MKPLTSANAAILHLEPRPASIHYRPWRDTVAGTTLLEAFITWWKSVHPEYPLTVLFHQESDSPETLRHLLGEQARLMACESGDPLLALASLEECEDFDRFIVVQLGSMLAPRDLVERLLAHHTAHGNGYTRVDGLAAAIAPEIFDRQAIRLLCQFATAAGVPSVEDLFVAMEGTSSGGGVLPVSAAPYEFCRAYGLAPKLVPFRVTVETPADVKLARRALEVYQPLKAAPSGTAGVVAWKRECLRAEKSEAESCARPSYVLTKSDSPRRILYASNPSAYSGAEESFYQLIRTVSARGIRCSAMVALEGEFTRRLRSASVDVICPRTDFGRLTMRCFRRLTSILEDFRPDVIHGNFVGMPLHFAAASLGIPVIQHVRITTLARYENELKSATRLIACSRQVEEKLLRLDIPPEKIRVVYDGIDIERFRPDAVDHRQARKDLGIPERTRVVLMVARFDLLKRHDLLIDAFRRLAGRFPDAQVLLAGEPLDAHRVVETLRARIRDGGLDERIRFLGFQPDIRLSMAAADVLVLPSDREALSNCVLEALAVALPAVVSSAAGVTELLRDGHNALIFSAGEVESLAAQLARALDDDQLLNSMRLEGRQLAEERFSLSACADQVCSVYEELLATPMVGASAGSGG